MVHYIRYVSSRSMRQAEKFSSDYNYITDSQEINTILDYIGMQYLDCTAMFILVGDGDYDEIWMTDDSHPYYKDCTYNRIVHYYRDV